MKLPPGISTHIFPNDGARRAEWICAIPWKNWQPAKKAIVCSLHFQECDFKRLSNDTNPSQFPAKLTRKHLTEDAIPSVFPNLQAYQTKKKAKNRSRTATWAVSHQNATEMNDAANQKFLEADGVSECDEILKIDVKNFLSSWNVITHTKSHQIHLDSA